jgi:hypothetical protein
MSQEVGDDGFVVNGWSGITGMVLITFHVFDAITYVLFQPLL